MAPPFRGRGAPGRTGTTFRYSFQQNRSALYEMNVRNSQKLRNRVTPPPPLKDGGPPKPLPVETKSPEGVQYTTGRKHLANIIIDTISQLNDNLGKVGTRIKFNTPTASADTNAAPPTEPSYQYSKITLASFPGLTIEFAVDIADPISDQETGASFEAVPPAEPYIPEGETTAEKVRSGAAAMDVTGTLMPIEEAISLARMIRIYREYEWQLQQFYVQELPIGSPLVGYESLSVYPDGSLTLWLRPPPTAIEDSMIFDTLGERTSLAVLQARATKRGRPQLVRVKRDWKSKVTAIDKCFPGGNFTFLAPTPVFSVDYPHEHLHKLLEAGTAPGATKIVEMRLWNEYLGEAMNVQHQDRGIYHNLAAMNQCSGIVIKGNRPALLHYHEHIAKLYKEHPEYFHATTSP